MRNEPERAGVQVNNSAEQQIRLPAIAPEQFVEHLERASREVQTWPAWKQELLGATAIVSPTVRERGPAFHAS